MHRFSPWFLTLILVMVSSSSFLLFDQDDTASQEVAVPTGPISHVTWSGSQSMTSDVTITSSETLTITAGTTVTASQGVRLYIEGTLIADGSGGAITFAKSGGATNWTGIMFNNSGTSSFLRNVQISGVNWGLTFNSGFARVTQCTITGDGGLLPTNAGLDIFNDASPIIDNSTIEGFDSHGIWISTRSSPIIDNNTIQNLDGGGHGMLVRQNSSALIKSNLITGIVGTTTPRAGIRVYDSNATILYNEVTNGQIGMWYGHEQSWILDSYPEFGWNWIHDNSQWGFQYEGDWNVDPDTVHAGVWFHHNMVENNSWSGARIYRGTGLAEYNEFWNNGETGLTLEWTGPGMNASHNEIHQNGWLASRDNDQFRSSGMVFFCATGGQGWGNTISNSNGNGLLIECSIRDLAFHDGTITGSGVYGVRILNGEGQIHGTLIQDNNRSGVRIQQSANARIENTTIDNNSKEDRGSDTWEESGIGVTSSPVAGKNTHHALVFRNVTITDHLANGIFIDRGRLLGDNITIDGVAEWDGIFADDNTGLVLNDVEVSNANQAGIYVQGNSELFGNRLYTHHNGGAGTPTDGGIIIRQSPISEVHNTNSSDNDGFGILYNNSAQGNYTSLEVHNNNYTGLHFNNSQATFMEANLSHNWDDLYLDDGSNVSGANVSAITTRGHTVNISGASQLWFINPIGVDFTDLNFLDSSSMVMGGYWLTVEVRNQHNWGVPGVNITVNHSGLVNRTSATPLSGITMPIPMVNNTTMLSGVTPSGLYNISAFFGYGQNITAWANPEVEMYDNRHILINMVLGNVSPFLVWDTPQHLDSFPSGTSVVFDASQSFDIDNDPLTWTWMLNNTTTLRVSNSGFENIVVPDGTHDITLFLDDGFGASHNISETRTIDIINSPPMPVISYPAPFAGFASIDTIYFDGANSTDAELDQLTYTWTAKNNSSPNPAAIIGTTSQFSAQLTATTTSYTITLWVADDFGNNNSSVITIFVGNLPPVPIRLSPLDGASFPSTDVVLFNYTGSSDPESDVMSFQLTSSIDGILDIGGVTTFIDPDPMAWSFLLTHGVHDMTVRLWDSGRTVFSAIEDNFQITINNTGPTAVISSPSPGPYPTDLTLVFDSTGTTDPDTVQANPGINGVFADTLTYTWESDVQGVFGTGSTFQAIPGTLSPGSHTITLTVDDGQGHQDTASVVIALVNSAPRFENVTPANGDSVLSRENVLFDSGDTYDPDGDPVVLNWRHEWTNDGTPASNSMGSLQFFTWNIGGNQTGVRGVESSDVLVAAGRNYTPHQVILNATDDQGNSAEHVFTVNVQNMAPVATISSPIDGGDYFLSAGFQLDGTMSSDPETDGLSYQWQAESVSSTTVVNITQNASEHFDENIPPGDWIIRLIVTDGLSTNITEVEISLGLAPPQIAAIAWFADPDCLKPDNNATCNGLEPDTPYELTIYATVQDIDGDIQSVVVYTGELGGPDNIPMLDNGLSGDVTPGDGVFTAVVELTPTETGKILVVAVDDEGQRSEANVTVDVREAVSEGLPFQTLAITISGIIGGLLVIVAILYLVLKRAKEEFVYDEDDDPMTADLKTELPEEDAGHEEMLVPTAGDLDDD